jgi:hypothetical protein
MTDYRIFYDAEAAGAGADTTAGGAGADTAAGGTGGAKFNLNDHLSEPLRQDPNIAKFGGDPEQLAQGYVHAIRMMGKDASRLLELPPADDDGTARRAVLQKLGLPADVANYELKAGEGVPDTLKPDAPLGKWFRETAHKAGILPDQAQAIYEGFAAQITEAGKARDAAIAEQREAGTKALKQEWGDAYDARLAAANYGMKQVGGDELVDAILGAGLDTNPTVLKAFAKIGMSMDGGAGAPTAGQPSSRFGDAKTPDELIADARALLAKAADIPHATERMRIAEQAQALFAKAEEARRRAA